jgi:hypothetical protein
MKTRKNLDGQTIVGRILNGELSLPPLIIKPIVRKLPEWEMRADADIQVSWGNASADFIVEVKPRYTPSAIMQAKEAVRGIALTNKSLPMVVVPYLSPDRVDELASEGMSALDLCGNGVVVIPERLFVLRIGMPNRFPELRAQRNPYRGSQSLVLRALLARPKFDSLNDLSAEIGRLGGRVSLPQVSRTVTALAEELIVTRERRQIQLAQPELLLKRLRESYVAPDEDGRARVRSPLSAGDLRGKLMENAKENDIRIAATGISSAERYAVLAQSDAFSVYCSDIDLLLRDIPCEESQWFPDLELIETANQAAYFDTRQDVGFTWASPVQTYLELMNGDARAQSIAVTVRQSSLQEVTKWR